MNRIAVAVTAVLLLSRTGNAQNPGEIPDLSFHGEPTGSAAFLQAPGPAGEFTLPSLLPLSLALRTGVGGASDEFLTSADSLSRQVKPRLLPDNISWMERGLWGETGLMRKIGIASPLTPEVRKHELGVRRTMLTAHQIGGFLTLGLMLTTDYFGQQYLNHGQRNMRDWHQTFLTATIISYSATGALAILSPPPLIRRDETSTTTIHKTLAWAHMAGMILTPILGKLIERRGSSYYQQAHLHQVSAYATTAIFTASMIVVMF